MRVSLSEATIKLFFTYVSTDISLTICSRTDPGAEASTSSTSTYSNPYTDPIPQSPPPASRLVYPTFPDVSLKKLPFFKLGKY